MTDYAMQAGGASEDHSHAHPSESVYIRIAIILTAITTAEVAIYYIDWFHTSGALVPALVIMSAIKFVTVIGYYMHLKTDDIRYRYTFLFGLVLALGIMGGLSVLIRTHKIEYGLRLISGTN